MRDDTFCNVVESAFAFLVADHGFSQPTVIQNREPDDAFHYIDVIFQRDTAQYVTVGAAFGRLEFDVILGVGTWPSQEYTATLAELLAIVAPTYVHPFPFSLSDACSNIEVMTRHIQTCARVLQLNGGRFFDGDALLWVVLKTRQEQRHQAYRVNSANERNRREALAAFQEGKWYRVVSNYELIIGELTAVEQKRLLIARRRLQ